LGNEDALNEQYNKLYEQWKTDPDVHIQREDIQRKVYIIQTDGKVSMFHFHNYTDTSNHSPIVIPNIVTKSFARRIWVNNTKEGWKKKKKWSTYECE
jgi:hypothetical protein